VTSIGGRNDHCSNDKRSPNQNRFELKNSLPLCNGHFSRQMGIREFKQITTAGATTATVTKKVWWFDKFEV